MPLTQKALTLEPHPPIDQCSNTLPFLSEKEPGLDLRNTSLWLYKLQIL